MAVKDLNGKLDLLIEGTRHIYAVVAKQQMRAAAIPGLEELNRKHKNLLLLADQLFPKIRNELRRKNINYIEANGNACLKHKKMLVLITANNPIRKVEQQAGRAFTKTNLKVVFEFLMNENRVNMPYRDIAKYTGTAIGNINNVMNDLKKGGYLVQLNKNELRLHNKKELLEKWITAYGKKLQPTLRIGRFRFLKEEDQLHWQRVKLNVDKNRWGGEPGGAILTNYLKPAEWTLYTKENRAELIKHYRLVPDEAGKVNIYEYFWKWADVNDNVAPPLLVYADLLNTNDPRCIETAQKIYEDYLQNKF